MKTLQINENNARKLYTKAPEEFKTVLEDTFTKEFFSEKITERVKTFEDACAVLGYNYPGISVTGSFPVEGDGKSIAAYAKLIIIARALNEGWKPDWSNTSEYKYVPWFKHKSGFGLSYLGCDYWGTFTDVGSRLCFKTAELAEYAGEQFEEIYRDYLTL